MATIDLTVERSRDTAGIRNRRVGNYTGPAIYATGGDSFAAADVALGDIEMISFAGVARSGTDYRLLYWDAVNDKIIWVVPNTGAEVANATDLSGFSCRFEAIGK